MKHVFQINEAIPQNTASVYFRFFKAFLPDVGDVGLFGAPGVEVVEGVGDKSSLVVEVGERVPETAAGEAGREELGVEAKGAAREAGIGLGLG